MTTDPVMEKAELAWTDDEARKFKTPIRTPRAVDAKLLGRLDASFPRLEASLQRAVVRGPQPRTDVLSVSVYLEAEPDPQGPFRLADALELELVQACFHQLFGKMGGEPLVVSPLMFFSIAPLLQGPPRALPDCLQETWEDFQDRNVERVTIPENFPLGQRETFLYSGSPDVGFDARDFFHRFPRAPGLFHFSRPGFDATKKQALIVAFRNDDLLSEARPHNHPTESPHFHQLCLLKRVGEEWQLQGYTDWTALVCQNQFAELGEQARKQRMEENLSAAGWRVQEWEEERLRLEGGSGNFVTVVTDRYLRRRILASDGFYVCADPVLIVPWLEASSIVDSLK